MAIWQFLDDKIWWDLRLQLTTNKHVCLFMGKDAANQKQGLKRHKILMLVEMRILERSILAPKVKALAA